MTTPKYRPRSNGLAAHTPDGIPLRRGPLPLREDEFDDVEVSYDFDCRVFDLAVADDLVAYREVMDRMCNGDVVRVGRPPEPRWSDKTQSYHVLVQWAKRFGEVPPHVARRAGG